MESLVEARRQYLEALYDCVVPEIIDTFDEMYDTCEGAWGRKNGQFQKKLLEIKTWNSDVIAEHVERMNRDCPWLDGLIRASLVSLVQIMNSVRVTKNGGKLSLTVPTTNDFVHGVYKNAAAEVYKKVDIMEDKDDRDEALWDKCCKALETTIRNSVPFQRILNMNIAPSDEVMFDGEDDIEDDLPKDYNETREEPAEERENLFED